MKKTVLMSVLMALCLSACSKSEESEGNSVVGGSSLDDIFFMDKMSEQDFIGYVTNNVFTFYLYGLSNNEPTANTRMSRAPHISGDYISGEWLKYCPITFYFENGELLCSPQMDLETYEEWKEYSREHDIELFVHSSYTYNSEDGTIETSAKILPAEKNNYEYIMGRKDNYETLCLALKFQEPKKGGYGGVFDYMYIYYERVSRNHPFSTELKVFDTNEEAVAYAKELMGI